MGGVKSYLGYNDIDIIPAKFKKKVTLPKLYREDEQAIDVSDVRKILLACHNRRLRTYLLILASGGMRTKEALAIRLKDVDFDCTPTKIHIRKEYAKTRVARDIYISDEATKALKDWIGRRYGNEPKSWCLECSNLVKQTQRRCIPILLRISERF
jgi:integrase